VGIIAIRDTFDGKDVALLFFQYLTFNHAKKKWKAIELPEDLNLGQV